VTTRESPAVKSTIMSTKLFVGNISPDTTEALLRDIFAPHGRVNGVDLIVDRFSGRSRGIAFVTMDSKSAADAAVLALNGKAVAGRALAVNVANATG